MNLPKFTLSSLFFLLLFNLFICFPQDKLTEEQIQGEVIPALNKFNAKCFKQQNSILLLKAKNEIPFLVIEYYVMLPIY